MGMLELLFDGDVPDESRMRGRKDLITQNPERAIKNILNGFRRFAKRYVTPKFEKPQKWRFFLYFCLLQLL